MWFRGDSRARYPLVIQSENSGKHDSGKHGHSRPYEGSVKVLHSLHRLFLKGRENGFPRTIQIRTGVNESIDQINGLGLSSSK